jgi:hypothetical protein
MIQNSFFYFLFPGVSFEPEEESMRIERNAMEKSDKRSNPLPVDKGRKEGRDKVEFRVKVSGALCHCSGYVQNDTVKNLAFCGSTSRAVRLAPGAYSLTVFVGADYGRENVDYAVELAAGPLVQLHVPGDNPIRAQTVGITGFVVIDFTLH